MKRKVKVGIIDDHSLFRSGVVDIINDTDDFIVDISVSNIADLYTELDHKEIEVLLLDIKLKEGSGLDVLTKLREENSPIKIIMLTMFNEAAYVQTMVKKGASGYLLKDTTPEKLLDTLHKVLELGRYFDTHTTNILVDNLQAKERLISLGIDFTQVEIEVIKLISEGLTAEEIGQKIFKSTRTVEGYRHKLLDKTKTKNIAELVSWAYKNSVL